MNTTSEGPDGGCFRRALLRVLAFDLVMIGATGAEWVGLGLVHPRPYFGLAFAHIPVWILILHHQMAPVIRWERTPSAQRSDAQLANADLALQHLPRRFSLAYAGLWLASVMLVIVLALAGIPADTAPFGAAELLTAVLFIGSNLIPIPMLFGSPLRSALLETHTQISALSVERGLATSRPPSSIDTTTVGFSAALVLATIFGTSGVGLLWGIRGAREVAVAEQRHVVDLATLRVTHGLGGLPEEIEVVPLDSLPAPLAAALAKDPSTSAAYYDASRHTASAARDVGEGRALVSSFTPDEHLDRFALLIGLVTMLAMPAVWYAARLNGRAISRPLEEFHAALQSFTERGELRALERIVPLHNDEIGRLAQQFNATLDILEELVGAAEAVADGNLRVRFERPGELHDAFRGMIRRLSETVSELRETSIELASAAAEIHGLTLRQTESAHDQATTVEQVNTTVGSLSTAARRIADTAKGVHDDAERALETTDDMVEKIGRLREQTTKIGELLDAIRTIADRSDLLALNGSLEAVRAGESGRGFGLVAAEMRRLAEQIAGILDDVREQVASIETAGASTVEATRDSRDLAQRTAEAARSISDLTHMQSEDTGHASRGMQHVAGMVANMATATSQTQAAAEGLHAQANRLEALLQTFETPESPESPES
jgi:methyl-accepting chemotaxis protein